MRGFLPDKAGRDLTLMFARVINSTDWKGNHTFTEKINAGPGDAGMCSDLGHRAMEERWCCCSRPWLQLSPSSQRARPAMAPGGFGWPGSATSH